MANYELRIYNPSGTLKAVVTDFLSLAYTKKLNRAGGLWFSVNGGNPILAEITDKWIVQIRRQTDNGWSTELTTLFRNETWSNSGSGPIFAAYCQGVKSVLWRRIVNYYSNYNNRSSFSNIPVETVVKDLVKYNLGSDATVANGRKREGTIANLSVEADSALGSNIYWNCHGEIVGETLYELSEAYDFDFDVYATSPHLWEFRFHNGDIGSDISSSQLFSMENGNMANPVWSVSRATEKTVACVWGSGQEGLRDYQTVLGPNHSSDNDFEVYVRSNADLGDSDQLVAKGSVEIEKSRATNNFSFDVLQSVSNKYQEDYDLGDIVSAKNPFNGNIESNMKIVEIAVSIDPNGKEQIGVEIESK